MCPLVPQRVHSRLQGMIFAYLYIFPSLASQAHEAGAPHIRTTGRVKPEEDNNMTTETQRRRRIRTSIFIAALLCLAIGSASNAGAAAFVNGSFETGDTTGWTTDCRVCLGLSSIGSGFDGSYWALVGGGPDDFAYYEQAV